MSKYIDADKLIHDLEERIFAYSEGYAEGDDNRKDAIETLLKDVKYQYSLQQEQPEKPVPNDLKEAAIKYADAIATDAIVHYFHKTSFIAGAKWDRSQMMDKAVEGEVCIPNVWVEKKEGKELVVRAEISKELGFKFGEKVRVIVLPKED